MRATRPLLPWLVWGVAGLAYAIAVINRSSLAALGPATQEHFGIDATTLAAFPVIQLIVYAGLQIPVGMLLDRIGASAMVVMGGVLMFIGQIAMATVADVRLAILARVLVGAGDACTFISVMRILPDWFALKQLPTVSQMTGLIGQTGQLVSVIPLAIVVDELGWVAGFGGLASVGFLVSIVTMCVMRDRPGTGTLLERMTGRLGGISRTATSLRRPPATGVIELGPPPTELITPVRPQGASPLRFWVKARALLTLPGVRLAFWVHFTLPFPLNVFVLLWGTPFLTGGIGLSPAAASGLLSLTILSSMTAGVVMGPLLSRFIERRVWITVGVTASIMLAWFAVLLWPGTPPIWLVIVMLVVMPVGGPASMIAFEVVRSHSPNSFAGLATGFVNTGGFIASLIVTFFIGFVLDLQGAGSPENYSLPAFRWAFAVQIPVWILGLTMIVIEWRRSKRWMDHHGRKLR